MIEQITTYIQPIIVGYGAMGVFFATIIEEIIAPIPSPLIPLTAGFFLLSTNAGFLTITMETFFIIAIPVSLGITLGSLVVYSIGFFGGKPFIEKNKKWLGLNWEDMERVEKKLTKKRGDEITLFILRLLPIIPGVAISGFCGVMRYPLKTFAIITFIGSFIRATILGIMGSYVGLMYMVYAKTISQIEKYLFIVLLPLILFFIIKFIFLKGFRSKNQKS
ncbi:MAG: VTT domain-containing protein [Patescibacteria group bacterium]|nr:VTT domain-containing protein [Patescibacteria group bacterium]